MTESNLPLPWFVAAIALRTAITLVVLVGAIRVFGKRDMGGLNLLDLLMVLLIGNAVQNALTQGSGSLAGALMSAGVLLLLDRAQGALFTRHPEFARQLEGEPAVLLVDGHMDRKVLDREGVSEDAVYAAMHEQGVARLDDVRLAVLEVDGRISVVPREHQQ